MSLGLTDTHSYVDIDIIDNKDLLYSTGNYIQHLVITYSGKESEKEYSTYITESLCCIPEISTTL